MKSFREILDFWWGEAAGKWWNRDSDFDRTIRERFESTLQAALRGKLEDWREVPESCLAYIVLLDQFSRNMYRGTPRAFAQDNQALAASLAGQGRGFDAELSDSQKVFFYLPMMHAEDVEIQRRSVEAFRRVGQPENLDFARRHAEIVERFGRFPHRNEILGRPSTPEEIAFLKEPNSSF